MGEKILCNGNVIVMLSYDYKIIYCRYIEKLKRMIMHDYLNCRSTSLQLSITFLASQINLTMECDEIKTDDNA